MIKLHTNKGIIAIELDHANAPLSAKNFAQYVQEGFYEGTIFHRVIPGFMIQGGGMESGLNQKATREAVENEADNGLENKRGSVAMARTSDPHSATAQFFINLVDNTFLNHRAKTMEGWGYTVFAQVTEGMDVVDSIAQCATGRQKGHDDVPQEDIVIERIEVIE